MSALKDIFEKAKARSLQFDKQKELQNQAWVASHEIDLNPDRRAENLRLLRAYLNAYQDGFVGMLRLGSQSGYSKMERGETLLAGGDARRIERELDFPTGWFERGNSDLLFLSENEFKLIKTLRDHAVSGAATAAINDMIEILIANNKNLPQ